MSTTSPPSAWSPGTTPGWYRVAGTVAVVAIIAFAALATIAGLVSRGSSATVENNTAPSLIAVQDLFAGVAEANAAATAVFLSGATGEEDRGRRNLYLDALRRSAEQSETVAGLVGDDDASHDALQNIAVALTDYSGQIEASRLANELDQPGAEQSLRRALDLTQNEIAPAVATVTERSQRQLDEESATGRLLGIAAVVVGVVALAILLWLQMGMFRRSNRLINVLLVLATLAVIATIGLVARSFLVRAQALDNAETGGYDAIATTSRLQGSAFELQSDLSLRLLGTGDGDTEALMSDIDTDVAAILSDADSPRERAAADELGTRWERYRASATEIADLAGRDRETAVARFQGSGLSTFNGLNTSIESVLSDNRDQFVGGVEEAADAVGWTPLLSVILPLLAALAVVLGLQPRLGEYQ